MMSHHDKHPSQIQSMSPKFPWKSPPLVQTPGFKILLHFYFLPDSTL